MFGVLLSLFRMVWPFLKESILEGGTVGEWIKRNRITCMWIVMLLAMFTSMVYMADMIVRLRQSESEKTQKVTALTNKYNTLASKYNTQLSLLQTERRRFARLRMLVANSCPPDSEAYRTLVAGVEALDPPASPVAADPTTLWCSAVQPKDLTNDEIRQRYVTECPKPQS